jgi:hypothetical protein
LGVSWGPGTGAHDSTPAPRVPISPS